MADLPIQPDYSSPVKFAPRVLTAGFGDGYSQRAQDGLNANPQSWELSYQELTDAEVQTLLDFFEGLGGVSNFTWQPKYSTAVKKFLCSEWGATPVADNSNSFTASIVEVFEP